MKGQAARLAGSFPPEAPVVGAPGIWIVPHADGTVGIGSTTESEWTSDGPDARLDGLVARARSICPWLRGSVLKPWAGLRPRASGPDPIVGRVSECVIVATGGYKTSFTTAPAAAALAARMIAGEEVHLPEGLMPPFALCQI